MHLHVNLIVLAESIDDAKTEVESWIEEHSGREFYDYGGLKEPEEAVLLNEISESMEEAKAEMENLLPIIEADIEQYKKSGNRFGEGYGHKRYGSILTEDFTEDMPFFNIENWNWSLPTEIPEDREGCNWYAVMADFHF